VSTTSSTQCSQQTGGRNRIDTCSQPTRAYRYEARATLGYGTTRVQVRAARGMGLRFRFGLKQHEPTSGWKVDRAWRAGRGAPCSPVSLDVDALATAERDRWSDTTDHVG
jgi:hypothetical protein